MFYTTKQKLSLSTGRDFGDCAGLGVQTASAWRIWWALAASLERRTLHLQARALCQSAEVSPPAFYAQCGNCNQARRSYEERLQRCFNELLRSAPGREAFWREVLQIITQNRAYFAVMCRRGDYWLLARVFGQLPMTANEKVRIIYCDAVSLLLQDWILREKCANPEGCLRKLLRIRKVDLGL